MTDVNAVVSEVSKLKQRLDQAQLSFRDASLKSRREIVILKRLITRLSVACRGIDNELDAKLVELRHDLEQPKDISKLIPRLAIIERLVTRQAALTEQASQNLEQHIHLSGDTLNRVRSLPAQLKRDLRNILAFDSESLNQNHQRMIRLLQLYENAVKMLSTSTNHQHSNQVDQDVLQHLSSELQHLITELDFTDESSNVLLEIRNKLLIGVNAETLTELSLTVLKMVMDGHHKDRRHSQKFMDDINSDLATLKKATNQTLGQTSALAEQRGSITTEFSDLAQQVQTGLKENDNLETYRPELEKMSQEFQTLVDRTHALEKRERQLLEQLAYNENKVISLYDKTTEHHRELNNQERKMFLDHLTKVYNRAAFNDRLEHEYRRWLRYQHPLCVALFDLDNFKETNVNFGYVAGDKALKIIARTIHQCLADTDFIARFDGDKFMVIMPDCNEEDRTKRITQIRENVAQLPFHFRDQQVSITLSVGATLFDANDTPPAIIERTQKALNTAKSTGTNRLSWIS
ncbi:diguanylate cyclase [Photobacterium jeanii]|uniref:diguanylate cyclase n=1 Tax=Photobacterium jeanii TaxID=858640 RepID=A0A178K9J3_9GAMM|nr:GGDEF domain-containing protein [Photobacterium jeanii]OAN14019.1 diguanylate cyclase [Photobacterium jeanii]PST86968.1 GGDEF domain-containing protein [Photobacterium jeanii]